MLRFRAFPENWAAIIAALMISETVKVVVSRFLSMRSISTPPKDVENQLQRRYYSIKWSETLMKLAM